MITKLTAKNQAQLWNDDILRFRAGKDLHYSIGQHFTVLLERVMALEAQGIAAQSDETQNAAQPAGQEPGPEGAP